MNFEEFKTRYQNVPVEEYPNRVLEAVPEPMVSVKISTYQHANFIRDCLDGVLMQETDFPIEILIGEDESTDGTREICKAYADRHPDKIRLFLHRRENNIAIHGRPTGKFQSTYTRFMCRGKYIALCEGDDYWTDPLKLQKQVDFLEGHPGYVLSFHDGKLIDSSGSVIKDTLLSLNGEGYALDSKELIKGPYIPTASMCFANVISSYPPSYFAVPGGDRFITTMLGIRGNAVCQADIGQSVYRVHRGGAFSSLDNVDQRAHVIKTSKGIYNYLVRHNRSNDASYYDKRISNEETQLLEAHKHRFFISVTEEDVTSAWNSFVFICQFNIKRKKWKDVSQFTLRSLLYVAGHARRKMLSL